MSRRYLRPGILAGHLLVLIAALVCLRLGWWQWDVAHETRGTIQNLGYAILWPVFGGAFIFMWLRFLHLEDEGRIPRRDDGGPDFDEPTDPDPADPARLAEGPPLETIQPVVSSEPAVRPDPLVGADVDPQAASDAAEPHGEPQPDPPIAPEETGQVDQKVRRSRRADRPTSPTTAVILAVATVGDDDEDDPELTAYNAALARLAEQDQRRDR